MDSQNPHSILNRIPGIMSFTQSKNSIISPSNKFCNILLYVLPMRIAIILLLVIMTHKLAGIVEKIHDYVINIFIKQI